MRGGVERSDPSCTTNNIPVSHLHVTSGYLQCIEAPAGAAHSGGMAVLDPGSLVGATSTPPVDAIDPSLVGATRDAAVGAIVLRSSVRRLAWVSAGVALAASVMVAAPVHGAVVDPDFHIVVRTYDRSATLKSLSPAFAGAAAILEQAGVGVTWVHCDVVFVQRDANPCLAPLASNELAIRFVRLPHVAEQDLVTLGDSLVDTRRRVGSLATIYVDRVSALASRCQVEMPTLLARAVAHEIGHLLLGTTAHASTGLMRAAWSQAAIRRSGATDWTFTAPDAHALRESVRGRNVRRLAAGRIGE